MSAPRTTVVPRQKEAAAEMHALSRVPESERRSGWKLSTSVVSVATALVILAIAGFSVILAGFKIGLIAGLCAAVLGFVLNKAIGHMSYTTGMSSSITSRFFGFGQRGSAIGSFVFAFMILGFLAMESALLYEGTLLMFGWEDNWFSRILIYAVLTVLWIAMAIFGIKLALRVTGLLTIITLLVIGFMLVQIYVIGDANPMDVFTEEGLVPGGFYPKFEAAFAVLGATVGTTALVTADFARYARNRRDVTILASAGPVVQSLLVTFLGAFLVLGGLPRVIDYVMARQDGLSPADAAVIAGGYVMENTGVFFVIFAGWLGFITMYVAQAKAQAINAYTGALSLVNIADVLFRRKPSHAAMVVLGNLISLVMIAAGILGAFAQYLAFLGCMTAAVCGVMIADFFIVRRLRNFTADTSQFEKVNWAGVISWVVATGVGVILLATGTFHLGFLVSVAIAVPLYVLVRKLMPEGTGTSFVAEAEELHNTR